MLFKIQRNIPEYNLFYRKENIYLLFFYRLIKLCCANAAHHIPLRFDLSRGKLCVQRTFFSDFVRGANSPIRCAEVA